MLASARLRCALLWKRRSAIQSLYCLGLFTSTCIACAQSDFSAALEAYKAHDYRVAAERFERTIHQNQSTALVLLYLGHSYVGIGERNKAKQIYYELSKKFPLSPEAGVANRCLQQMSLKPATSPGSTAVVTDSNSKTSAEKTSASVVIVPLEDRTWVAHPRDDHPAVGKSMILSIRSAICGLPANLYKILNDGGTIIVLAPNIDDIRRGSGDSDKPGTNETMGEEGGRTYGREIHIYERMKFRDSNELGDARQPSEILHIFYHEIAHALDDCLGKYSNDSTLKELFQKDLNEMPPDIKAKLNYFTVPVEGCAETVCGLLGGSDWSTASVMKYLPRTQIWLRHKLGL